VALIQGHAASTTRLQLRLAMVVTAAPASMARSTAPRSRRAHAPAMAGNPMEVQAADSIQAGRMTTCTAASAPSASDP